MKQALFFLFSTILTASATLAQTKREIIEEDPKLSPNLRLEISPLDLKTAAPYSFGGASARLSYRGGNKFTIMGEFRKEYFDFEEDELADIASGYTIGNPKPYAGYGVELTGTYYFKTVDKEVDVWLPIKSKSVGYRTIEVTVDPVSTTKLILYGIRGGYAMDKATNNIVYGVEISEVTNPSNKKTDEGVIALETRGFFFGGLSMTRIKNVKVHYPAYGMRRKQVFREFYADVLYGTDPKADNVVQYDSGTPTTYKIDNYGTASKIGWRLGVFSTSTGKLVNCGYGVEIASTPGGSWGLNVKFVLSLFKKAGLKEE